MRSLAFLSAAALVVLAAPFPALAQFAGAPVLTQVPTTANSAITESVRKQAEASGQDAAAKAEERKDKAMEMEAAKTDGGVQAPATGANR